MHLRLAGVVVVAVLLSQTSSGWQVNKAGTVLEGVFSAAQAQRGKVAFETSCASCHKADLTGFSGPPLKGTLFMDRWREFKLSVLLNAMRETMPKGQPGGLPREVYVDILAYAIQSNGLPPGNRELTPEVAEKTLLVGLDGSRPLPSSSNVRVVGCLTLDTAAGWFLTRASEPVRTLNPWDLEPQDLPEAKATPTGGALFKMANIADVQGFEPSTFVGKKVLAKGVLVLQPNNARVNVNTLQVVDASCD